MAVPTLIATAGAVNANSYVTLVEADLYHDSRLHNAAWLAGTTDQKNQALLWATQILDRLDFQGRKTNDIDKQSLRHPRVGMSDQDGFAVDSTTIHYQVKNATCELAGLLISTDRTADAGTEGFREIMVGPIVLKVKASDRAEVIAKEVYALLKGLIIIGLEVSRG